MTNSTISVDSKPLRVLYDISVLGAARVSQKGRTGVFRVVDSIAKYLLSRADIDVSWTAYGNYNHLRDVVELCRDDPGMRRPVMASLRTRRIIDWLSSPIEYLASTHFYKVIHPALPLIKRLQQHATFYPELASGFDIVHNPFSGLPSIDTTAGRPVRFLTVYDLIPIKFPHLFVTGIAEMQIQTLATLGPRDWVLCISESTRNDLLNYRSDLTPENVRVTPLAAAEHFRPCVDRVQINDVRDRLAIPKAAKYFLSVCTLEPRKNLRHLISVFAEASCYFDEDTYLVLVGAKGWHVDELLAEIHSKTAGRVIVTGYVPDQDLAPLYSDAIAFVYPSLYEGFGLPPLEAMQCGRPVIASNNSSLPEVVGDAGILIPAEARDALADAMIKLYHDADFCRMLGAKGVERAKLFSWQKCSERTVQAYYDAL